MSNDSTGYSAKGLKFSILCLGSIATMCTGLVSPALPFIAKEYSHLPHVNLLVKFIVTIPHLTVLIVSPFIGYLTGRIDRKIFLCGAVIAYGLAGSVCAFVRNLYFIWAMRVVLGVCISIALSCSLTLIADCLRGQERSSVTGLQTTFMSIGTATMYSLGGIVADINWHYNFLLYLLPVLMVPFAWRYLFEPRKKKDFLIHVDTSSGIDIDGPEVDKGKITILSIYFISVMNMVLYYMIPLQLPFLLAEMGMNAKKISLAVTIEVLACAACAAKYKRWKKNRDFISICAIAFATMSISYMLVSVTMQYYLILLAMALYGVGMGIMMPNNSLWVISSVKSSNRGVAVGGLHTSTYSGKFVSALVIYPIVKATSMKTTFMIASILMVISAISISLLSEFLNKKNKNIV